MDDRDIALLRASKSILANRTDAVSTPDTRSPIPEYRAAVRERFAQWILDTASAEFDERGSHTKSRLLVATTASARTRRTASVASITLTLRPFLEEGGASPMEVDGMLAAWLKAVED